MILESRTVCFLSLKGDRIDASISTRTFDPSLEAAR
ncbi:hypothetical protein Q31b_56890 [Novipirellula aureliae]|uniref:Uncharacterized protein n=1 Tax=Novipirellula aureliae TaxID=2527966 RepID=A0A5C6D9P0_9BACT|nr:hypothetical protein Q31b_56890 [Novipirellula aureliae]